MSLSSDEPTEHDDVFGISEDFVQSRQHDEAVTKPLSLDGLLNPPLLLHEDVQNGNGGRTWIAGLTLAKYILRRRREELENARIVDLGSGNGIVGLAVAASGCRPQSVHVTDQQAMLELMRKNIKLNNLQDVVKAAVYDWGESKPEEIPQPDIVLVADCVYFEPAFPLLQQTLRDLIGPSTTCFFCFKRRRRADLGFLKTIRKHFIVEDITDDPDKENYARENIYLLTIRKKPQR